MLLVVICFGSKFFFHSVKCIEQRWMDVFFRNNKTIKAMSEIELRETHFFYSCYVKKKKKIECKNIILLKWL